MRSWLHLHYLGCRKPPLLPPPAWIPVSTIPLFPCMLWIFIHIQALSAFTRLSLSHFIRSLFSVFPFSFLFIGVISFVESYEPPQAWIPSSFFNLGVDLFIYLLIFLAFFDLCSWCFHEWDWCNSFGLIKLVFLTAWRGDFWVAVQMEKMLFLRILWVVMVLIIGVVLGGDGQSVEGRPHRILLDTDVDTDDFFAILYLLKLNRSEFDLQVHHLSLL